MVVVEGVRRSRMGWPQVSADGSPLQERLAFLFRAAVAVVWRALILVGVASVTFYPFTKYYATAYAGLRDVQGGQDQDPRFLDRPRVLPGFNGYLVWRARSLL